MTDLITPQLIRLDADLGADKDAVIRSLAGVVAEAGRTGDTDQLIADAMARETVAVIARVARTTPSAATA